LKAVKSGSMRVIYHPTKQMVSDYLTKPLQGSLKFELIGIPSWDAMKIQLLYVTKNTVTPKQRTGTNPNRISFCLWGGPSGTTRKYLNT
jgi:hypothetical protein